MSDPCSKETNDKVMERLEADIDRFCERACNAENKLSDAQAEIERLRGALEHCAVARLCASCEKALERSDMNNAKRDQQLTSAGRRLAQLRAVVDEQAEDEGLWFIARTAPEAYLQAALRRLHELIEGKASGGE